MVHEEPLRTLGTWFELLGADWWNRATTLAEKLVGDRVYPPADLVFQAFREVAPGDVSVIILGQDPYHSPGKARGVAFGYHPDYAGSVNSSMMNIVVELSREFPDRELAPPREWYTLRHLTDQGVLLLNTRLTVEHEKPMSHAGEGWEELIAEALQKIYARYQPVMLCWGSEAQKMANRVPNIFRRVDTSHPCRYSANRGKQPFLGSDCFLAVNGQLVEGGDEPINWTGDVQRE